MKKLVLKTVAITVGAILSLMAAIYFVISLVSPKTLAGFWKDLGSYSVAAKYYERQYNKSGTVDDLSELCVYLDAKRDGVRTAKYLKLFTESDKFSERCAQEDERGGFKYTAYEYYYGKYTVAEFYANKIEGAIVVAKQAVSTGTGYSEHNAFYVLLIDAEDLSASDGNAISAAVTEIKSGLTDATQIGYADRDIGLANSIT